MGTQIVIVDDDPIVGNLTLELLRESGFTATLIADSLSAMDEFRAQKPALAIIDVLMPGIDGITLLHRMKSDPDTMTIRAVVVSGKTFAAEKSRALAMGADLFVEKPYDVQQFGRQIADLLQSGGVTPNPGSTPPVAPRSPVGVRVWGGRPAGAVPSKRYGSRSLCVAVDLPRQTIIFDAGTGIIPFGNDPASKSVGKELMLFLTSFGTDHTEGLAQFARLKDPACAISIAGPTAPELPLEKAFETAVSGVFGKRPPPCRLDLYEMLEHSYEIASGVKMQSFYANHPGTTLGYVLAFEGRKIAYVPASEIYGDDATSLQDYDEKLGGHIRGADILFHDARHNEQDHAANKNSGHSDAAAVVALAAAHGVQRVVLINADGRYNDDQLDALAAQALTRKTELDRPIEVMLAREGLGLSI